MPPRPLKRTMLSTEDLIPSLLIKTGSRYLKHQVNLTLDNFTWVTIYNVFKLIKQ